MSLNDFDWSTFVAEMIDFPADVVFEIMENGQLHEIKAHKMILGMVSPIFKTMFTTDVGDKIARKIKIEETTTQALQIIIDHLYKIKSIEDSLEGKSLQEIFDVVNVIERYQMAKLQESMNEVLNNFPISDDTVLEVAAEAIHHSRLFQKEAHLLLLACAKFLMPKLKDATSIFKYAKKNGDQKETVAALLAVMDDIAPTGCSNCGYEDCRDGKEVKKGEFREGLLVTNNPAATEVYWGSNDWGIGIVTKVDDTDVIIEQVKYGVNGHHFSGLLQELDLTYDDYNFLFIFSCK